MQDLRFEITQYLILLTMQLKIFTDGGARGNPGPAAIGVVIYDKNDKILFKRGKYIGETTNNQAEYQAIVLALEKSASLKAAELEFFLDSELVVKQLAGEYKVRDENLAKQFLKVWNLKNKFKKVTFRHVRREKNTVADALVNQALDKKK